MDNKPSFKTYLQSQFRLYSYFIKCEKTGYIYEEVHWRLHMMSLSIIANISCVSIPLYVIYNTSEPNVGLILASLLLGALISIIISLLGRMFTYRVSKFRVVDKEKLKEELPKIYNRLESRCR